MGELIKHSRVRRRYLGVTATVSPIPRYLVRELDLLSDRAVEVVGTEPSGPAAAAGIIPGDLIVAVNDRLVTSVDDVHRLISDFKNQPLLRLTIVRGKRKLENDVRLVILD